MFGRLRDGASRAAAQAELRTLASQWNASAPAGAAPLRTTVVPINEQMVGRVTDLVWLTFLTVGALVLLIACANVANLLLMRGAERSHELAIRTGLGASRARLVRQLLVEGLVLAVAGGTIGLGLSLLGLRALSLAVPADVPFLADLRLDGRVMAVLLLTSLGSVVLFGLAPALHLSNVGPNGGLASGGRTATRTRRRWWIATFLAVEFALTLVLACSVVLGMRFNQATRAAQVPVRHEPALHGVDRAEPADLRHARSAQRLLRSCRGRPPLADGRRSGEHRQRYPRRGRTPACGDDRRARPGRRQRPRGHDGRRRRRVLPHAGRAAPAWPRHCGRRRRSDRGGRRRQPALRRSAFRRRGADRSADPAGPTAGCTAGRRVAVAADRRRVAERPPTTAGPGRAGSRGLCGEACGAANRRRAAGANHRVIQPRCLGDPRAGCAISIPTCRSRGR